ncbi:MAG: hypothetical protein V3Q69_06650 [Burkholderia sp.]
MRVNVNGSRLIYATTPFLEENAQFVILKWKLPLMSRFSMPLR